MNFLVDFMKPPSGLSASLGFYFGDEFHARVLSGELGDTLKFPNPAVADCFDLLKLPGLFLLECLALDFEALFALSDSAFAGFSAAFFASNASSRASRLLKALSFGSSALGMGSGRSESAADAPKQGAFPAGLIGAEPIDLAAVRQGERIARQVAGILKDFASDFAEGQNRPHSRRERRRPAPTGSAKAPYIDRALATSPPIGKG